jgi:hypothetical protein
MKTFNRGLCLLGTVVCLASPVFAQGAGKTAVPVSGKEEAALKVIESTMTPGEGQQRLDAMIGTFAVKIRTWSDPATPPVESLATSINAWVLDQRYVQSMLSGHVLGAPFNGIGYMAFDNVTKTYQAAWMDTGSTGITWYTGGMDASGKSATLKASIADPLTKKPTSVELRLTFASNGDHVTEVWGKGSGRQMFKLMDLQYTKQK